MNDAILNEFSVLSPSQKKELERKRKEKEARETAEAIRKAEAARKAKEAAKRAEEERLAAIRAENAAREAEKQSKKNRLMFWTVVLVVLIIVVAWIWIHGFIFLGSNEIESMSPEKRESDAIGTWIFIGIMYFLFTSFVALPIFVGIGAGIKKLRDKIKEIKYDRCNNW